MKQSATKARQQGVLYKDNGLGNDKLLITLQRYDFYKEKIK
ncbi:transaldolase [Capnocytophaga sp. oral taxon 338 str. F0234]|nr:transaldolase [Capnocytophaga sp. oral taxon 338 str. F0234]